MEIGKIGQASHTAVFRGKWLPVRKAITECKVGEGFILTNTDDGFVPLTRAVYQNALAIGMKVSIRQLGDGKYQIIRIK